jgi:hypothetical protein
LFKRFVKAFSFFALAMPSATAMAATVVPTDPYTVNSDGYVHYAVPVTGTLLDLKYGFRSFDLSKGSDITSTESYADLVFFDVHTNANLGTTRTVVSVTTTNVSDETKATANYLPIAFAGTLNSQGNVAGTEFCGDQTNCQAFNSTQDVFLAARYTSGTTLRIGLYPKDICSGLQTLYGNAAAAQPEGCTSTGIKTIGSGVTADFKLTFVLGVSDPANPDTTPVKDPALATEVAHIKFKVHNAAPTATSCPAPEANYYFPGDGEIYVRSDFLPKGTSSGGAPITHLVVVGGLGSIDETTSPTINNAIQGRPTAHAGTQVVQGFTNTTNGADNAHVVAFALRDAAGQLSNSFTNCKITGVQSSAVNAFLTSSKCFIATAAYQSADVAPVMMLREFRDQVLDRFWLGREFIQWYYSWSPGAAEWLLAHPQFRYPVLIALVPVELLAWVTLNPLVLLGLLACLGGIFYYFRTARYSDLSESQVQ